jgi:hypothetical protein
MSHATDDADDDYMSMIIEEPTQQRETLTQRKLRKQREVSPSPPFSLFPFFPFSLLSVIVLTVPVRGQKPCPLQGRAESRRGRAPRRCAGGECAGPDEQGVSDDGQAGL